MEEILKKLLEANLLTEDTKNEIQAAFTSQMNEAIETAKADAIAEATADVQSQFIQERDLLIESLDAFASKVIAEEFEQVKDDINRFYDVEAAHAEKLVEAREELAVSVKSDIQQLIESLDQFVELRLAEELDELKTEIETVKQVKLGRRIFEAFKDEFKQFIDADDESVEQKLAESEQRIADTQTALVESEKKYAKLERTIKMEKVLSPLSGRSRQVMEAILKNVETQRLEEGYNHYIGHVLAKESAGNGDKASEKEEKVLAEGVEKNTEVKGQVKTGDDKELLKEHQDIAKQNTGDAGVSQEYQNQLRKLAGIQ